MLALGRRWRSAAGGRSCRTAARLVRLIQLWPGVLLVIAEVWRRYRQEVIASALAAGGAGQAIAMGGQVMQGSSHDEAGRRLSAVGGGGRGLGS